MDDSDCTFIGRRIGYSDSIAEAFGITRLDRRRHPYVQGKTGSGKSTLALGMIDPLGHTAEAALSHVPRWRTGQVRYLNVADLRRPVGLN